jgi:hypothetical protein
MKFLLTSLTLVLIVTTFANAQSLPAKLEGQVVCCAELNLCVLCGMLGRR